MPGGVARRAAELRQAWQADFDRLGTDDGAHRRIDLAIDELRAATLDALRGLD